MLEAPKPLPRSKPGDPIYPSTAQHRVIIEHAHRHGWQRGAEIGVLKGKTLNLVLSACPGLHMIAVDAWTYREMSGADGEETYRKFNMADAERMVREVAARHRRVTILKGESVDMAPMVQDGGLDFVFIDAGHTTEAVTADILAWMHKVRPGGLVMGHDWWFPSVRAALNAELPGWQRHEESVWSWPVPSNA